MEDKKIICKDCGKEFIFLVGEQQFYQEKGFTHDPTRCKECRDKKKVIKNQSTVVNFSNNFDNNNVA